MILAVSLVCPDGEKVSTWRPSGFGPLYLMPMMRRLLQTD